MSGRTAFWLFAAFLALLVTGCGGHPRRIQVHASTKHAQAGGINGNVEYYTVCGFADGKGEYICVNMRAPAPKGATLCVEWVAGTEMGWQRAPCADDLVVPVDEEPPVLAEKGEGRRSGRRKG